MYVHMCIDTHINTHTSLLYSMICNISHLCCILKMGWGNFSSIKYKKFSAIIKDTFSSIGLVWRLV